MTGLVLLLLFIAMMYIMLEIMAFFAPFVFVGFVVMAFISLLKGTF